MTEEETALAIRMAASSRIAYVTILAHSRTDGEKPRTLHLDVASTIFMNTSKNKPVKLYEDDKKWFFKVGLPLVSIFRFLVFFSSQTYVYKVRMQS